MLQQINQQLMTWLQRIAILSSIKIEKLNNKHCGVCDFMIAYVGLKNVYHDDEETMVSNFFKTLSFLPTSR